MHAEVLPLNRANLVAAGPLLEAERIVIVVPLGPDDQGLLLGTNLLFAQPKFFFLRNPSGTFRDVHW